ncbi:MAG: hypothetical protein FWG30_00235 [Eubacteriaceae bacterium]|nr:hypothetical protein [Eubacteriaceae bacterium]
MPIAIWTEEELGNIGKKAYSPGNSEYVLECDIKLRDSFKSISPQRPISLFGNGYMLSGLTEPLFSRLAESHVENLALSAFIDSTNNAAALCLLADSCTFEAVTVSGEIRGCGCIAAYASQTVFSKIINNANIIAAQGAYDGGICGEAFGSRFEGCINNASLISKLKPALASGGIVGAATNAQIISCGNFGYVKGNVAVGGICGDACWVEISNCISSAEIEGNSCVGGICGRMRSAVVGSSSIASCTKNGSVVAYSSLAGGICGDMKGNFPIANRIEGNNSESCMVSAPKYKGAIVGRASSIGTVVQGYESPVECC